MKPKYCCFYLHQHLNLGWIRDDQDNTLNLVLPNGKKVRQRKDNLLLRWEGDALATPEETPLSQLQHHDTNIREAQPDLKSLYESLEPGEVYTLDAIAQQVSPPRQGGWEMAALFIALLEGSLHFRYSQGRFTPRDPEEMAMRARREEERRQKEQWMEKASQWKTQLEAGRWDPGDDPDAEPFLDMMLSILIREKQSPHWPLLAKPLELFHLHSVDLEARLKNWLITADAWPDWPAVWLRWGEVPTRFDETLLQTAEKLSKAPARLNGRVDYRQETTYTIDSPGTLDMDDAVTLLEADAKGLTLALHISEPPAELLPGNPLYDEAARRVSSVYTVNAIFPMFPTVLSNQHFSLLQDAERETVTYRVRLDDNGARMLGVERGLVRVARNLDYTQAQLLLGEQSDTWGRLASLCKQLAETRLRKGAIIQERRDIWIDATNPDAIKLDEIYRSGPVHQLVEELAIVYNSMSGEYCTAHQLPAIYRVQPSPRPANQRWQDSRDTTQAARFSVDGEPHAGLACERYSQTTSPIRRFSDLVMQRQIIDHATAGRVVYQNTEQLSQWAEQADGRQAIYNEVAKRIADYWKRRYLAQNPHLELEGLARKQRRNDRIWLTGVQLLAECTWPQETQEKDKLRVRIDKVNVDQRRVQVRVVT